MVGNGVTCVSRQGLNHKLAGFIDPGFKGQLVLELKNELLNTDLILKIGQRIGQLTFHNLSTTTSEYVGSYNNQRGAVGAQKLTVSPIDPSIILQRGK